MLITLSHRTAICQSVAEVQLTDVAPLGAFNLFQFNFITLFQVLQIFFWKEEDSKESNSNEVAEVPIYVVELLFFIIV